LTDVLAHESTEPAAAVLAISNAACAKVFAVFA